MHNDITLLIKTDILLRWCGGAFYALWKVVTGRSLVRIYLKPMDKLLTHNGLQERQLGTISIISPSSGIGANGKAAYRGVWGNGKQPVPCL